MRHLIALMLLKGLVFAQAPAVPPQGPPPKQLNQKGDGRFSANGDPANPERFDVHLVAAGETLSGIAGSVLKDPRLWPQLWEQNEHIVNPHWIYPNDKILIRPITPITEAVPPAPAPEPEPPAPAPQQARTTPRIFVRQPEPPARARDEFNLAPPPRSPEIKPDDLYCSGFVRVAPVANSDRKSTRLNSSHT